MEKGEKTVRPTGTRTVTEWERNTVESLVVVVKIPGHTWTLSSDFTGLQWTDRGGTGPVITGG